MKLDEIVKWYQKKIGTYDKQQWEKTVEQKILDGFSSVTLKTAKLKTDLIDVDLVRGSTFPKAKSKQSLLTVIRLAILRYFLLPIYAQWWVRQTSPNIFAILLFLYITQMINWAIYSFNVNRLDQIHIQKNTNNTFNTTNESSGDHKLSISELLIPMGISILLSLIHSQIVATNSVTEAKTKHRRFSSSVYGNKVTRGDQTRVRRRKKLVKIRSQDVPDITKSTNHTKKIQVQQHSGVEMLKNVYPMPECTKESNTIDQNVLVVNTTKLLHSQLEHLSTAATTLKLDLSPPNKLSLKDGSEKSGNTHLSNDKLPRNDENKVGDISPLRKRNVNWQSPIHKFVVTTQEKQQQTSPQSPDTQSESSNTSTTTTTTNIPSALANNDPSNSSQTNSHSSSNDSSFMPSPNRIVLPIDHCVQEFYEDLIMRTDALEALSTPKTLGQIPTTATSPANCTTIPCSSRNRRHLGGEDDGFESLNGKSSSGEDTQSPLAANASTSAHAVSTKNCLRQRLNAAITGSFNNKDAEALSTGHTGYRRKVTTLSSESDLDKHEHGCNVAIGDVKKPKTRPTVSSEESEEDDGEAVSSPASILNTSNYNECTTSATEWLGVTTNSDECSYSSELDNSDDYKNADLSEEDGYDADYTSTTILNPHGNDRISVTIWDHREIKKAQMSVLEISSCIIERVESMPETHDYIYFGIFFSLVLSCIPCFCRLCEITLESGNSNEINYFDLPMILWKKASFSFFTIFRFAFGYTQWERTILIIGFIQRLCLTLILFIIFAVAERTFKQRFLYAKLFSHLTSSRRARKSNLPHFRLNKVRNIKTWLSVRSYLKKRGPQRSVDVIVSAAFMVTLLLLSFLSVEWLKDSANLHTHLNFEALLWSTTIGVFLLRFMTLGNKIHTKYRSVSVLITEQINLYLQIERKPKKKDELMVSNSVLKLAADLLKELESPFKISGLSANPYLFTTIKVVILSALSGVLSEMLGFKLKLHKIKIK